MSRNYFIASMTETSTNQVGGAGSLITNTLSVTHPVKLQNILSHESVSNMAPAHLKTHGFESDTNKHVLRKSFLFMLTSTALVRLKIPPNGRTILS